MQPDIVHFTKTRILLLIILVVVAFAITALGMFLKKYTPDNTNTENTDNSTSMRLVEPPFTEEFKVESWQTAEEKEALLFRRLSSINVRPLSRTERKLIISLYGDGKSLSEAQMRVVTSALNK